MVCRIILQANTIQKFEGEEGGNEEEEHAWWWFCYPLPSEVEQLEKNQGLLPESQDHDLALTV